MRHLCVLALHVDLEPLARAGAQGPAKADGGKKKPDLLTLSLLTGADDFIVYLAMVLSGGRDPMPPTLVTGRR